MRILVLVITFVFIVTSPCASAQDNNIWVGKRVVFKEPTHSPIDTGDQHLTAYSQVFTVKRTNRDLLYIVAGEAGFWVPSHDVLPQEKVSDYLTDQIRLNPRNIEAYARRGLLRMRKKDYDDAIADFDEVIKLSPKTAWAYFDRALGWQHKGDFARAIAGFSDAIQLDPRFAAAYNGRARIWATCTDARFRDAPKAIESARRACELSSGSKKAIYLDTLAAAYAAVGDFANAVKAQAEANTLFARDDQRKGGEARLILYQEKKLVGSERKDEEQAQ